MNSHTRETLTKAHLLLAAFIFPAVLMYIVTGSLYTWGTKGSYLPDDVHMLQLDRPLTADMDVARQLMTKKLKQLNIALPTGGTSLEREEHDAIEIEWEGSKRTLLLESTDNPLIAKLIIQNASWYRNFVQLHKAKGGTAFKVYAVILATTLFASLASGFIMAWQVPRLRRLAGAAAGIGLALFVIVFSVS